jgi:hypothetical protein
MWQAGKLYGSCEMWCEFGNVHAEEERLEVRGRLKKVRFCLIFMEKRDAAHVGPG